MASTVDLDRRDFVLLATAAGRPPVTPVQLQKALFLIGQECDLHDTPTPYYNFEAHHYGPFALAVYADADTLHTDGLVVRYPSPYGWTNTVVTPDGLDKAEQLRARCPQTAETIKSIVEKVQSLSFRDLVSMIYDEYPNYRANSVFQEPGVDANSGNQVR